MTKMIIFMQEDYADEFDYSILSFTTKEEIEKLLTKLKDNPFEKESLYHGINEAFDFSSEGIIEILEKAKEITEEEIEVLKKFTPKCLGVDIINWVVHYYA